MLPRQKSQDNNDKNCPKWNKMRVCLILFGTVEQKEENPVKN